jgi:hypothetical protein
MGFSICGYGMYLNDDELEKFVDAISHDEQYEEEYGWRVECAMDLTQQFDVALLNYDEMWGGWRVRFIDNDYYTLSADETELTGAFFFAQKQGSIIAGSDHLYSSVDEIVNEMREEYGEYLPDGFDYAKHIAFMCGYESD